METLEKSLPGAEEPSPEESEIKLIEERITKWKAELEANHGSNSGYVEAVKETIQKEEQKLKAIKNRIK